jgi:MFS family permease
MLVNLVIGSYYNYSNINPYIAKYFGVGPDDTIVVSQIWLLTQSLFSILGVKLSERFGYWSINYFAFAGFAILNFAASFITTPIVFVACYGILSGIFIGLGYLPALYTAWTYFPESKSVATGAILFCAGMSASILSPVSTYVVNPQNLKSTDPAYGERVPLLFRFLGIYFGVICLIACTLQPRPLESAVLKETTELKKKLKDKTIPKEERLEAKITLKRLGSVNYNDDVLDKEDIAMVHRDELAQQVGQIGGEEHAILNANIQADRVADLILQQMKFHRMVADDDVSSINEKQPSPRLSRQIENNAEALYQKSRQLQEMNCPSVSAALDSSSFYMLALMSISCSIYPYFLNSNWKVYYQTKLTDISDSKMSFILSFGAVANSSIRLLVGVLLLKIDIKFIYYFIVFLSLAGAFTISELLTTYEFGVIYIMMAYMGLGTQVTLFPTICTKVFGSTVGPKVYPYIYLCFSVSNFAQYFAYKFYGKNGHIETVFVIFGSIAFVGVVLAVLFNTKPSWTNAIYKHNLKLLKEEEAKEKQNKLTN